MYFGENFMIGAATAAHQVEGENRNSDYWAEEQLEHSSFLERSGLACDHYIRYEDDIRLMAEAGLSAYRFSIEWARIEPEEGIYDPEAIEHYRKVISCCRVHGLEPMVTLMHFTSPKWLIAKGGWAAESTVEDFARYCSVIMRELGEELSYVCTINEANMGMQVGRIAARYRKQAMQAMQSVEGNIQVGINYQQMMENQRQLAIEHEQTYGCKDPHFFIEARDRAQEDLILRAHVAARQVIRVLAPHVKLGLTLSLHDLQAGAGGEQEVQKAWEEEFLFYLPALAEDDFLGVQNYTRSIFGPEGEKALAKGAKQTQMGYEFYPQALEHVIRRVHEDYAGDLIVTENGVATDDDADRILFLSQALEGVSSCLADQIPIKGYFYWSLMDNFEWQKGYDMKFGLIAVDRESMERRPKESLSFLGTVARGRN